MSVVSEVVHFGEVERIVEWDDGRIERKIFKNCILEKGRQMQVKVLTGRAPGTDIAIARMIFGDGGTHNGVKKYVNASRNGLFGITRLSKTVVATIDPSITTQASFVTVIPKTEGNGLVLNEMALEMGNGELYSLLTFEDWTKTNQQQITWIWRLNFV